MMNPHKQIIEALLNGCNPVTGEVCSDEILNEESVRNMLQWALAKADEDDNALSSVSGASLVSTEQIEELRMLIKNQGLKASSAMVTKFLLGSHAAKFNDIKNHHLFQSIDRKFRNILRVQIDDYFEKHVEEDFGVDVSEHPFFNQAAYNKLSDAAVRRLEELIFSIGIIKKGNDLTPAVMKIRKEHPRSHEPWSEQELDLLNTSLAYTNDLDFLSKTFQRGRNAMYLKSQLLLEKDE